MESSRSTVAFAFSCSTIFSASLICGVVVQTFDGYNALGFYCQYNPNRLQLLIPTSFVPLYRKARNPSLETFFSALNPWSGSSCATASSSSSACALQVVSSCCGLRVGVPLQMQDIFSALLPMCRVLWSKKKSCLRPGFVTLHRVFSLGLNAITAGQIIKTIFPSGSNISAPFLLFERICCARCAPSGVLLSSLPPRRI